MKIDLNVQESIPNDARKTFAVRLLVHEVPKEVCIQDPRTIFPSDFVQPL